MGFTRKVILKSWDLLAAGFSSNTVYDIDASRAALSLAQCKKIAAILLSGATHRLCLRWCSFEKGGLALISEALKGTPLPRASFAGFKEDELGPLLDHLTCPEVSLRSCSVHIPKGAQRLFLNFMEMTEEEMKQVAANPLIHLEINNCWLEDRHAQVLCNYLKGHRSLKRLVLRDNLIGDKGEAAVRQLVRYNKLPPVDMLGNWIDSRFVQ